MGFDGGLIRTNAQQSASVQRDRWKEADGDDGAVCGRFHVEKHNAKGVVGIGQEQAQNLSAKEKRAPNESEPADPGSGTPIAKHWSSTTEN